MEKLMKRKIGAAFLCFAMVCGLVGAVHADTLTGLPDITVANNEITEIMYNGTTYVVANGDLALGTTTRHYIIGIDEFVWSDEDADNGIIPTGLPTVPDTSNPKTGDPGYKADNFNLNNGGTNISSIDGIDFQETIFEFLTNTIFVFERNGNDNGTVQAILADGSLGAPLTLTKGGAPYASTGVNVGDQTAYGYVLTTDVRVQGLRITASGHDSLSISTPARRLWPVAINPEPDGKNVGPDETFEWTFVGDDIVVDSYFLYMDTNQSLIAEPNALVAAQYDIFAREVLPDPSGDGRYAFSDVSGIQEDTVYYWRLDTIVLGPNAVNPEVYDVSELIEGLVWSFVGLSSIPEITLQPVDLYIQPDPVTHTLDNMAATFTVGFTAGKPLQSIVWMKDGSPLTIDGIKYVQADDVANLADASTVLTINNLSAADEGAYSVEITLETLGEGSATSDEATLSVVLDTDILAHRWSFNGDLTDSVGGADAVIVDPDNENIVLTADEVIFGGVLEAGDNETSDDPNLHFVDLPNGIVSALSDHATFMMWYTIEDPATPANVRVFTAGDADGSGTEAEWVDGAWTGMIGDGKWVEIVTRDNNLSFGSRGTGPSGAPAVAINDGPAADYLNQEVCMTGVWDGPNGQMALYVDGVLIGTATPNRKLSDLVDVNNWLGRSNSTADKTFVGRINEFRIYGIPMTAPWVKALYKAGPNGEAVNVDPCHNPKAFDYDDDCAVGLGDLGIFAEHWLECGFLSCQ